MTKIATQQTTEAAHLPVCLICFEDSTAAGEALIELNNGESLSPCTHFGCRVCLKHYLIQCENDRHKPDALCPDLDCKAPLSPFVTQGVLGRAYTPKEWEVDASKEEKPDPMLLNWLRQNNCQQCQNCKAWIDHDDGCEAMQCLCGWRFCWYCLAAVYPKEGEEGCSCGHSVEDFYDNIRGNEGYSQAPKLATADDLEGFAAFYERRKDEGCSDYEEQDSDDADESVVEEAEAFIGCIFDYEEPATGVYEASCFDLEEQAGALIIPFWSDLTNETDEKDEAWDEVWDEDEEDVASVASSLTYQSCQEEISFLDWPTKGKQCEEVVEDSDTASMASSPTYASCHPYTDSQWDMTAPASLTA